MNLQVIEFFRSIIDYFSQFVLASCIMSKLSHEAGDSVVIASIDKHLKQLLGLHSSLLRRVKRMEAERKLIAPPATQWICPVCHHPFPQRDSLKGHVR